MASDYLGLDIGSFNVKFAQIKSRSFSKHRFISFAISSIKDGAGKDRIIEAIKTGYKQLNTNNRKVNISVSGLNIITRYMTLPRIKESDLRRALEFELEKFSPYKREDMIIDYSILTSLPGDRILILLVASDKNFIQDRIALVKEAGLEPQSVNIDALALTETFKALPNQPKGLIALLDIGYRLTKLIIIENNIPYFSRDIEIGEYNVIESIAKRMGIKPEEAKKIAYQNEKSEILDKVLIYDIGNFSTELSLSFQYCERTLDKKVEQILITGGGSNIGILVESLKKISNIKSVDFLNIAEGFKFASSLEPVQLKQKSLLLAIAIGLAL
ncbi:MAG: pilus assembly protein PilM [Candidatus Omnitrophica bacterium]|nr:pilus assembly protein PilM [Candidatus Omnitrophota bacterium]